MQKEQKAEGNMAVHSNTKLQSTLRKCLSRADIHLLEASFSMLCRGKLFKVFMNKALGHLGKSRARERQSLFY